MKCLLVLSKDLFVVLSRILFQKFPGFYLFFVFLLFACISVVTLGLNGDSMLQSVSFWCLALLDCWESEKFLFFCISVRWRCAVFVAFARTQTRVLSLELLKKKNVGFTVMESVCCVSALAWMNSCNLAWFSIKLMHFTFLSLSTDSFLLSWM